MAEGTGAESAVHTLWQEGAEVVFGVPGGAILPIYDAVPRSPVRHILARHEQGAGHMAEGYAQVTGGPGVVFATSGPGATNLVTPLMNALVYSTPLVAITGQVATISIETDAFQEVPTAAITKHCTKRNWLVTDPAHIADVVAEAFAAATTGRPGPVLIDIPKNVQATDTTWHDAAVSSATPGPTDREPVETAIGMIERAPQPTLFVGGGALRSRASTALLRLAETTNIPVVTTLMGRGAFPDLHPLALGIPEMHGDYTATTALQRSDLTKHTSRVDSLANLLNDHMAQNRHKPSFGVDLDLRNMDMVRTPPLRGQRRAQTTSVRLGAHSNRDLRPDCPPLLDARAPGGDTHDRDTETRELFFNQRHLGK